MKSSYEQARKAINNISNSFCAAKWYNVSLWLGNGRTASCHHPLAHSVPKDELEKDASALHNTSFKKLQRKKMLEGERPSECSYCWTAEDATGGNKEGVYSDRIYQTARYSVDEINALKDISWDKNVNPKTVEICFDNLCNLACSYCNAEFSSTWHKDISNGPYGEFKTGGGNTYNNDGRLAMPFGNKNEGNIYVKRFFEWFEEIRDSLDELRVSGGEPCRSPHFWRLLEICKDDKFRFAVNSNLIMDSTRLDKLIAAADNFSAMDIYTSAESLGKAQQFVRDGFDWNVWKENMFKLHNSGKMRTINIMMTISVLSIWGVKDFLEEIIRWRKFLGTRQQFFLSVNILRFPSFQSINMLPADTKLQLALEIEEAVKNAGEWLKESEISSFNRLTLYLKNINKSYEDSDTKENKIHDLKTFLLAYEKRRNMPMLEYMPDRFNNWFKSI